MSLQELAALTDDIQAAIMPYVDEEQEDEARAAARAAVQTLIENGALEIE